jgi:hypothetical protein
VGSSCKYLFVLSVTGDCVSITGGVLIHFDNEFLSLYEKCVDNIYDSVLKWFYDAQNEDKMPIDNIKAAMSKVTMLLGNFQETFLHVERDDKRLQSPFASM